MTKHLPLHYISRQKDWDESIESIAVYDELFKSEQINTTCN